MAPPPSDAAPRRLAVPALSALASVLLLVALVLANAALARTSVRLDLTEEGLYTLSPATKKILASLSDPAEIRVYWADEIPASANVVKRRVEGLLDEYAARSNGRLTVTWLDMSPDGPGVKEAAAIRDRRGQPMPKYQFRAEEGGQLLFSTGYMGLSIRHLDQLEFVGPLADPDAESDRFTPRASLEYDVTTQLWRMIRGKPQGIGLVKDSPGFSFAMPHGRGDRFSELSEGLERLYGDAAKTWISLDDAVPTDVSVLIVAAPKEWPEKKVFHLEQFLLRGGKVILLLDPVNIEVFRGSPPAKSGLEAWLSAQGVDVSEGVVLDMRSRSAALVPVSEDELKYLPYAYYVMLDKAFMSGDHPLTAPPDAPRLDRIPMYYPVELKLDEAKQKEAGRKGTVLATTTDAGYLKPDTFGLNRIPETPPNPGSRGRHPLIVALEGPFTSFWKGKPSPADPPPAPPATTEEKKPTEVAPGTGEPPTPPAPPPTPPEEKAPEEKPPEEKPPEEKPPEEKKEEPKPGDEPPPSPPSEGAMDEGSRGPEGEKGDEPPPPPAPPAMEGEPKPEAPKEEPAPAPPTEPAPSPPKGDEPPAASEPAKKEEDAGPPKAARLDEGKGVLVVVGDAEMISDHFSGGRSDVTNGVTAFVTKAWGDRFVLNAIDWMLGNEELASLRVRGKTPRLLAELEPSDAKGVKLGNYLGAPLLVILAGILVWVVRRYRA
jgi:ABC-type uncharacterized transport system involved in gliding motility auxiliary subunit